MDGNLISLCFFVPARSLSLRLWLIGFAGSAACSRTSANAQTAKMQRWHQPGDPLQKCHFSGIEGASRRHQNVDSAVSAGRSASQFGGKYAKSAQLANHLQYLLPFVNFIHN